MTTQRRFTVVVVERDRLGPYARSQLLRDAGYRVIETSTNEDACSAAMRESAASSYSGGMRALPIHWAHRRNAKSPLSLTTSPSGRTQRKSCFWWMTTS